MNKRLTLGFAILSLIVLQGCGGDGEGSSNSPTIFKPTYQVGQSWTYLETGTSSVDSNDDYAVTTTRVISQVESDGSYTISYNDPTGFYSDGFGVYNSNHALTNSSLAGVNCTFTPPMMEVKFPLAANRTWTTDSTINCDDGSSAIYKLTHSTGTSDSVIANGVTYSDGYMIKITGTLNVPNQGSVQLNVSAYYSPSVGAVVSRKGTIGSLSIANELQSHKQ